MKTLALLSLLLGLSGLSLTAHAEGNCPPGYYPIGGPSARGCAPIPGYGGGQQAPQASPEQWADRWGAIATDGKNGVLGSAANMTNKSDAAKAALSDCQRKGGSKCKLDLSYSNGCGVMVVGNKGYSIDSSETTDEAVAKATKICGANDTNCNVYFSSCSLPVRVQ